MALKDRFVNLDIEDLKSEEQDIAKTATPQAQVEEADLAHVIDELALTLSQKVASIPVWFDYTETEQKKLISDFLINKLENDYSDISFSKEEKEHIISLFMNLVHGFGELDCYIAKEDIKSVCVNSDGSVYSDNGISLLREESVITPAQFEKLYCGLTAKNNEFCRALKQIRLNKLVITIFAPPVCEKKILFEKLKTDKVDFNFLIEDGSINQEIYEFIRSLISGKKNILIAGAASSGKTALISAVAAEIDKSQRCAMFENYPIINCGKFDKYSIKGLNENELADLFSAVSKLRYDYIINDTEYLPAVLNELFKQGYYADIEAESITQAITKLAGHKVYNEKCTEKQAKADIATKFEYIFLLEKNNTSLFKITSIARLSLNKAGSLVLTEISKFSNGNYINNFSDEE